MTSNFYVCYNTNEPFSENGGMNHEDWKAAAENFAKSDLKEAKLNNAALDILNGNYDAAAAALAGSNSCNEALAYILTKQEAKASAILNCNCPCAAYKRAIIAARKGDNATAKKEIEAASKSEKLAKRAAMDIEFAKVN